MKRKTMTKRLLSMLLSVIMMLGCVPISAFAANVNSRAVENRVVDYHTLDQWKNYFGILGSNPNDLLLSTEYAGGVWTDKSVFSADDIPAQLLAAKYNGKSIALDDTGENFLVSLSAIASNKQITGYSTLPTDTVFILDLSSSMRSKDVSGGSAIDELVDSTNKAIDDLLSLNHNNRVAVVLYSGNTAGTTSDSYAFSDNEGATRVVMPLDSYTTSNRGVYLDSIRVGGNSDWGVSVNSGVKNSNNTSVSASVNTQKGTFMQDGIYEAMKVLINEENVTVETGVQAGADRMPIMVLMTDGEPTLANPDYNGNDSRTDLGTSSMYNFDGSTGEYSHRETIAFTTMLTAAFAKKQVREHYNLEPLFYTLGFGDVMTKRTEVLSILDTTQISTTINAMWAEFLSGGDVTVYRTGNRNNYRYTTVSNSSVASESLTASDKSYVNKYFHAPTSTDLGNAFDEIVGEIIIQSKYYPTYVESDHNHDGYLTFVDKIGRYMDVHSVCGIVVGEHLFSGEALASHLTDVTAAIGEKGKLTAFGSALIASVMERMNIPFSSTAYDLVMDAIKHKQFYVDANGYSNYIGWLSDSNGSFLEFWHEGMLPEDISAVQGATHIIRSYGFLGDTSVVGGVSDTDMMYMSVRVTTEIATGDTIVTWRLPASLIPTVTYEVSVNVDSLGNITEVTGVSLEDGTANAPIRLLYEVGMRADIHDWNIRDIVGTNSDHYNAATDTYTFYTNKWDATPSDTTKNTYSHFEPSAENERYYYTTDTLIYADTQGTIYKGAAPVTDGSVKYYRQYPVYEKLTNGSVRSHYHYEQISTVSLALAEEGAEADTWVIPKGTVHRYYDFEISEKTAPTGANPNPTGTMAYSDHPFIKADGNVYYTYSTQGNNGRLTLSPATGFALVKYMQDQTVTEGSFTFTVTTTTGNLAGAEVVRLDEDHREASREPLASDGKVTLGAWELVYIVGLSAGQYRITEDSHDDYVVKAIGVDGRRMTDNVAIVDVIAKNTNYVYFMNGVPGKGNLVITKEVSHAQSGHTVPSAMLDREFEVTVDFGTALAGKQFDYVYGTATGKLTVGEDGKSVINIKHGESYEIFGIPEGSVVTVTETTPTAPFSYVKTQTRDHAGAVQYTDSDVTIGSGTTSTAVIYNKYQPKAVEFTFNSIVSKTFEADTGFSGTAGFSFYVQKWNEESEKWDTVKTLTTGFTGSGTLSSEVQRTETISEAGEYSYQIIEYIPTDPEDRVPGVVYDRSYRTFTVVVTDNGQGQLTASLRAVDGTTVSGINVTASFTNTHHTAPLYFDINKNITNDSGNDKITAAGFEFKVSEYSGASLDALTAGGVSSVYSDAAGKARFAKMLTLDDGVNVYFYKYVVEEVNDARPGWKYNIGNKTYELYFKVVRGADDTLSIVEIDANGTETPNPTPVFTNVYAPTAVTVNPSGHVTKRIEGRPMSAADKFTFAVFRDGEYSFHDTTNALLIGENVGENVVFKDGDGNDLTLSFNKEGTYKFDVVEIEDQNRAYDGLTYSKRVYDLVVEVYDKGDGTFGERHYFEDALTDDITFVNTYEAMSLGISIIGTKTLTGRKMLAGEFDFTLTEVADAQGTAMTGGITRHAENGVADAQGEASFRFSLYYTEVGTHYYKITENKGTDGNGVTYDESYYIVEVDVTDDNEGFLTYTKSIVYASNGKSELVFNNTYTPADISAPIPVFKDLEGRVLGDGEFEFIIRETEADFTTVKANGLKETVKNDAHGNVFFSTVEFDGAEVLRGNNVRYFVIREVAGDIGGITYDKSEYHVTVRAIDNLDGTLSTATEIYRVSESDDGQGGTLTTTIPVSSVLFENKYAVTGTTVVTVSGTKRLNGETPDVQRFPFTFELYSTAADGIIHEGATPIATTTQDADGRFSFDIPVGPEHISATPHHFVVREKYAGEFIDHVLYDSKHYHIDILVEDDREGVLKTTTVMRVYGSEVSSLDFDNMLDSRATLDLVINKTVKNTGSEKITPEGFEFIVKHVEENVEITLTADESGVISLPLKINEAFVGETVTLLVSEKNTGREHVTYSDAVYTIVIKTSLGEGNKLLPEITVNGKKTDKIELAFENVYDYSKPVPVPDTGDSAELSMWAVLLCVSMGGIIGAEVIRRRRREQD